MTARVQLGKRPTEEWRIMLNKNGTALRKIVAVLVES